ncbi:MAG: hypothetical protein RL434_1709 [Pseudomonadota bacterium]|jgi:uncharacterized surface protein with fasciclin (FAS1) repeats
MKKQKKIRRLATLALALGALQAPVASATSLGYFSCIAKRPITFNGTIVDAAVATPALSTLVSLVQTAGLVTALNGPGPLTVFAPTNDAFGKIPGPVLTAIGGDTSVLTAVLTYHVAAGRRDPRASLDPREIKTLQGQSVFFDYDNGPEINQSKTTCQPVKTTNGTVWIIDSVLLPQFR